MRNLLGWLLLALASSTDAFAAGAQAWPKAWTTSGDQSLLLAPQPLQALRHGEKLPTITLDASVRHQPIAGFGAAITDASAWLIQRRMSEPQRAALLGELFGRGPGGVGFSAARLTLGASDFSLKHYSLADAGPDSFSIDENRAELLPVVKQALAHNPQLQLIASPWSAPGWMKTSGSLVKGTLKPEMFDAFAKYLLRYVDAYAAEGVPIAMLTVQNEPHFEPDNYPGMRLMPEQRAELVGRHLGPMLAQRGGKPRLLEWDHNWDVPESPLAVLADATARPFIAGVAWHCYGGDVRAQSQVREAYPDKEVWFTECSGGEFAPRWASNLLWNTRTLVIGATRHWARGVLLWNLALDEKHGPHLGGCGDCRGVVTINSHNGEVTRNPEYYALAHASRFLRPGARRVESSGEVGVDHVAFRNEDDGSRVLIVANAETQPRRFAVREGRQQAFAFSLPAESVATLVLP